MSPADWLQRVVPQIRETLRESIHGAGLDRQITVYNHADINGHQLVEETWLVIRFRGLVSTERMLRLLNGIDPALYVLGLACPRTCVPLLTWIR